MAAAATSKPLSAPPMSWADVYRHGRHCDGASSDGSRSIAQRESRCVCLRARVLSSSDTVCLRVSVCALCASASARAQLYAQVITWGPTVPDHGPENGASERTWAPLPPPPSSTCTSTSAAAARSPHDAARGVVARRLLGGLPRPPGCRSTAAAFPHRSTTAPICVSVRSSTPPLRLGRRPMRHCKVVDEQQIAFLPVRGAASLPPPRSIDQLRFRCHRRFHCRPHRRRSATSTYSSTRPRISACALPSPSTSSCSITSLLPPSPLTYPYALPKHTDGNPVLRMFKQQRMDHRRVAPVPTHPQPTTSTTCRAVVVAAALPLQRQYAASARCGCPAAGRRRCR